MQIKNLKAIMNDKFYWKPNTADACYFLSTTIPLSNILFFSKSSFPIFADIYVTFKSTIQIENLKPSLCTLHSKALLKYQFKWSVKIHDKRAFNWEQFVGIQGAFRDLFRNKLLQQTLHFEKNQFT